MRLKGIITGLLADTPVGLFFAPKSGKETRERIRKERAQGGTGLEEFAKTASATAGSFFGYLKKLSEKTEDYVEEEFLDMDKKPQKKSRRAK